MLVTGEQMCWRQVWDVDDKITSKITYRSSTLRVMDRPFSFLKIICLANTHLFHRGSFSLTQKIVCFHGYIDVGDQMSW